MSVNSSNNIEQTFQVKDKVKVISGYYSNDPNYSGKVGTIYEIDYKDNYILYKMSFEIGAMRLGIRDASNLELVSSGTLKIGNRVKVARGYYSTIPSYSSEIGFISSIRYLEKENKVIYSVTLPNSLVVAVPGEELDKIN